MKPKLFFPVQPDARQQYWPSDIIIKLHEVAEVVEPDSYKKPWTLCPDNVQALVIGWGVAKLFRKTWQRLKKLRLISIYGGSTSYMEEPVNALKQGIILANASPQMGEAVAEVTIALMFAGQYNLVESAAAYRASGQLSYLSGVTSISLTASTVGLIGFGFIGRKVAELLQPFKMRLLVCDPYVNPRVVRQSGGQPVTLEKLLRDSNIISLHAGWTSETEGMLGAKQLDLIKPGALIVSTARMPIFDQRALADRILKGRLRFASDFIPFDQSIWSTQQMHECHNLIAVHSHTSVTERSVYQMAQKVVTNIEQVFAGKEPNNKITEEWIKRTT